MNKEERQKELLLQLRSNMISKFKCEPFKILPDSVIDDIINAQPQNKKQLASVKGLPKEGFRASKYGEAIISIIRNYAKIESVDVIGNNDDGYEINLELKKASFF